jgi:hypothetical protein
MVKKAFKTAIFQLCDANMTLATIFFSISAWLNHPIFVGGFKKKKKSKSKIFRKSTKFSKTIF